MASTYNPSSSGIKKNAFDRVLDYIIADKYFWVAIVLVLCLRFFTPFYVISWPFSQFGTYIHELFHGLGGVLVGSEFVSMEVFEQGGGVAWTRSSENWQRAVVSASGLIGPSIIGAIMLMSSRKFGITNWLFGLLSFLFLLTSFLWAKGNYTLIFSLCCAALFFVFAIIPHRPTTRILAMFVAVQLCFENLIDVDYMFTASFDRDGQTHMSDTSRIATWIGGTYWIWAILIALLTVIIVASALYWSTPKLSDNK